MMKTILLPLMLLLSTSIVSGQTQYFVSTSGNNSNSGTSIDQAWRTIQHAMDNATPNSEVNIVAGTYNEKVEVNVSGTAGNTITFQNNNTDVVTVSGAGIGSPDAIIGIFDQSYIIIKGLNIANNEQLDAQGIILEGNCQHIEIRNNDVSNIHFSSDPNAPVNSGTNSQPIIVYGIDASNSISNLIIDGNAVHDCRTGFSEGLAVNGNVDGFEVTNNTLHDITNIGIDLIGHEGTASSNDQARNGTVKGNVVYNCKSPYATAAGIYVDGAKEIVIENNTVYQCQWGIEVGCENVGKTASDIKVRNNIIYGNDDSALSIGGFDFPSGSGKVEDCLFTNNSCYNNDRNDVGVGGVTGEINIAYTESCVLENNIFYATNTSDLVLYVDSVGSINLRLDYNQFFVSGSAAFEYEGTTYTSLTSYQTGANQDANSIFGDPQFENIATPDLHLTSSSPALDLGNPAFTPEAGETDMDGENRVQNGRVDMGADEYHVVVLDSFTVTRGDYVSGGLPELAESDNMDLSIRRRSSDLQSRTEFEVKGISPSATPTSFEFALEGSVFARGNVVQTIELFDYDLGDWELVDTSNANRAPMPDKVVTATPTGDLSRFVEAGTMCIEARIRYKSDRNRQNMASNTDQAIWTIGQ